MKTLGAALVAGALALSTSITYAEDNESILRLRAIQVEPQVSGDFPGLDADNAAGGEVALAGFMSAHWAIELGIGTTKRDLSVNGANVGSGKWMPVNLVLQFHVVRDAA